MQTTCGSLDFVFVIGSVPEIVTERLVLEPLETVHAIEMVDVLGDVSLYEFTGGVPPDLNSLTVRYEQQMAGSPVKDEQWFNWIIRVGSVAVGYVQATVNSPKADIAWVVGVSWQGRGIASEAAIAMASWLRAEGVSTVTAHIHPSHGASQSVAHAVGLAKTGEIDSDGEEIWSRTAEDLVS